MVTLKQDKNNANQGTSRGLDLLKQSLQELGAGRSGLIDKDGHVIAGNKTLAMAEKLGLKVRIVPSGKDELIMVQREDLDLTDPTGEARRLAYLDNRVAELDLAWDVEQVSADMEAGLDLDGVGFLEGELRQLLEQVEDVHEAALALEEQTERADELIKKWKVERGQVWQLGEHRVMCGDATDFNDIEALMGSAKAALCFTSPPYWVGKEYETQTSEAEIDAFVQSIAEIINVVTRRDESRIVINTATGFTTAFDKKNKRQVLLLIDKWTNAFQVLGWNLRYVRHWIKEGQLWATSPKTDLIDQHNEFLAAYEHTEGEPKKFDDMFDDSDVNLLMTFYHTQGKQRGQERTGETWALRSYWNDLKGTAGANGHVAAFPVELPLRHLMLYTKRGEIVFEPFCGGGTSVIACEIMKRHCRAMELLPKYVAATLERLFLFTGKMPVLAPPRPSPNDKEQVRHLEREKGDVE